MDNRHTLIPRATTTTIQEIKTIQKSHMGHHESAAATATTTFRCKLTHSHRRLNRRKRTRDNMIKAVHQRKKVQVMSGGDDDDQNKEELERKIVALQRIVPGGGTLGVDKLFEETADYILALQCQIKAMKVLTNFIEGLEKDTSKFGA